LSTKHSAFFQKALYKDGMSSVLLDIIGKAGLLFKSGANLNLSGLKIALLRGRKREKMKAPEAKQSYYEQDLK